MALPKEGKRINVEVNVVGISNVLISVYRCKNAWACNSDITYSGFLEQQHHQKTFLFYVTLPKETKRINLKVNIVRLCIVLTVFTFVKLPVTAAATLLNLTSLNNNTTKKQSYFMSHCKRKLKEKIYVNLVGIFNVLISVYTCKNAYNCRDGVTYLGHCYNKREQSSLLSDCPRKPMQLMSLTFLLSTVFTLSNAYW